MQASDRDVIVLRQENGALDFWRLTGRLSKQQEVAVRGSKNKSERISMDFSHTMLFRNSLLVAAIRKSFTRLKIANDLNL